ncbi:hypothetical protein SAMN06265367_103430 [Algoriphagus winogradskyi]|uniref:Uncharacterized protein n=2 Tax=Algoriphagus winogradskyi TaxID=237017 RepID=A0ABY1P037_9BACT|nr:hypothetical protein SAMN06265367_103430 [Algoriphagus winogradskyi]
MGFGFNLGMILIVLPLTGLLLLIWLISRKKIFGIFLAMIWGGILGLVLLSAALRPFFEKIKLDKNDYYGEYIIDRTYFLGEQADWQYNHFRFEVTEDDSIFFHVTEGEKIIKTYKGTISSRQPYSSTRLAITMNQPTHHVVSGNPTTYRDIWDFHLVFYSPKFNNMYFRQGEWEPIEEKN